MNEVHMWNGSDDLAGIERSKMRAVTYYTRIIRNGVNHE